MTRTTRVVAVDPDRPEPAVLSEAAEILRRGGLVAFPTETVYGLGADATNPEAVRRIFEAKGRPPGNPLIVHVASVEMARACVSDWPESADRLAGEFWPGPLTLVLPSSGLIPEVVTAGLRTVGVRLPMAPVARVLVEAAGLPVAAPSANRSTGLSPTLASHVLRDLDGKVDLILDGGQTEVGLESTVVDLSTRHPHVLRPGPVGAQQMRHVLGAARVLESPAFGIESDTFASPGQMAVHYAPRTTTIRVDQVDDLLRIQWPAASALVVIGETEVPEFLPGTGPSQRIDLKEPETAGRNLYVVLHQCDASGAQLIVVVPPPEHSEWHALRDRIWRASRAWQAH